MSDGRADASAVIGRHYVNLESYGTFQKLRKKHHIPWRMGFGREVGDVDTGDINRFNSRFKLARQFEGIDLKNCKEKTTRGYAGFCKVFLTHSALERFNEINCLRINDLSGPMMEYEPQRVINEFFGIDGDEADGKGKLYGFVRERIDSDGLKKGLDACKERASANVAHLSAGIRHIFAHGELSANVGGMNPQDVYAACSCISDFLLQFMDAEFTKKINAYANSLPAQER